MINSRGFYTGSNLTEQQLDSIIYADTNFILDIFDPTRNNHSNSFRLLEAINVNNSILTYSDHTEDELLITLRTSITKDKYGDDVLFQHLKQEDQNNICIEADQLFEKAFRIIGDISEPVAYDTRVITSRTREIRSAFGNRVHEEDAKHLGIMYENGLNSIATNDKKLFLNSSGLNVYGGNKTVKHNYSVSNHSNLHDFNTFNSAIYPRK